jgi:hypothetical protein
MDEHPGTLEEYARAARLLWGDAGAYAAAEFRRLNGLYFRGELPPLPIVINLTAYGHCIGLTRPTAWLEHPRITVATEAFNGSRRMPGGRRMVTDVLTHEMVHAWLILRGETAKHNDDPWCKAIADPSPAVLGHEINVRPVRPRRVPNPAREHDPKAPKTIVVRRPEPGTLSQRDLARWPTPQRPDGYYDAGEAIEVPTH